MLSPGRGFGSVSVRVLVSLILIPWEHAEKNNVWKAKLSSHRSAIH